MARVAKLGRIQQIGVTLTPQLKNKLYKFAKIHSTSVSRLAAIAIKEYLDRRIAEARKQNEHIQAN